MSENELNRRNFVKKGSLLLGSVAAGNLIFPKDFSIDSGRLQEDHISPVEDLMREHGILQRILLVYGEGINKITNNEEVDPLIFKEAAGVIREFVENYHEMQEEKFLFPRFRDADEKVPLVDILLKQHNAGRKITSRILSIVENEKWNKESQIKLAGLMSAHIKMYRPHEAWEDTVLFPAFKKLVSKNEYDSLAEEFEKAEHEAFGEGGFERFVEKAAELEKKMGIHDLDQFTPPI